MQFLVERFCPASGTPRDLLVEEPFPVWVDYNDCSISADCGHMSYAITAKGMECLHAAGFDSDPPRPGMQISVCEHMGRLIE